MADHQPRQHRQPLARHRRHSHYHRPDTITDLLARTGDDPDPATTPRPGRARPSPATIQFRDWLVSPCCGKAAPRDDCNASGGGPRILTTGFGAAFPQHLRKSRPGSRFAGVQVGLEPLLEAGDRLPQTPALPENDALRLRGPMALTVRRRGLRRSSPRSPAARAASAGQDLRTRRGQAAPAVSGTPGR